MTGEIMKYQGLYTAIVTPFKNDKVDYDALQALVEAQIAGGVDGIVPVGTTGESPTLDHHEHMEVIRRTAEFAAGRCQVIAGTGSNATIEAVEMTKEAADMGVDGTLQVCPYYNKPNQEGLTAPPCPSSCTASLAVAASKLRWIPWFAWLRIAPPSPLSRRPAVAWSVSTSLWLRCPKTSPC